MDQERENPVALLAIAAAIYLAAIGVLCCAFTIDTTSTFPGEPVVLVLLTVWVVALVLVAFCGILCIIFGVAAVRSGRRDLGGLTIGISVVPLLTSIALVVIHIVGLPI